MKRLNEKVIMMVRGLMIGSSNGGSTNSFSDEGQAWNMGIH